MTKKPKQTSGRITGGTIRVIEHKDGRTTDVEVTFGVRQGQDYRAVIDEAAYEVTKRVENTKDTAD